MAVTAMPTPGEAAAFVLGYQAGVEEAIKAIRAEGDRWDSIEQGDMPGFAAGKFWALADKLEGNS